MRINDNNCVDKAENAEGVIGNVDNILIDKCNEILKEVVNA